MSQSVPPNPTTGFPHTDWSLVRAVQCVDAENQREVLGRFLQAYIPALRAYLQYRRFYTSEAETEDLLFDFVADKLVADHLLTKVRDDEGLLRSFLKKCLDNYAISKLRKRRSMPVLVGSADPSVQVSLREAVAAETPCPFDLGWARQVVTRATALTHEDCFLPHPKTGLPSHAHIWAVFHGRLIKPMTERGSAPASYEDLAEELGADSVKQVQNWLVTGQRKFQKQIMRVIREYAPSEEQALQEIRDLFDILSSANMIPIGVDA